MSINETAEGQSAVAITGKATGKDTVGVRGNGDAIGVWGQGLTWNGVVGISQSTIGGAGVFGANDTGAGIRGESKAKFNPAVHGHHKGEEGSGVQGEAEKGTGVIGKSETWIGVYGETNGSSNGPAGLWGDGKGGGFGVKGHASGPGAAGVAGFHLTNLGPGIFGKGAPAGRFEGDVDITGNLTISGDITLRNADCAEDFDVCEAETIEPGTVMVLSEGEVLRQSQQAYDKCVAGVVSGAGDYKPGIVFDKQRSSKSDRKPIALLGKVFCKVDASYAPIEVGDLLTTSSTRGHAMKATDPLKAFGAVIGKALRPLRNGRGLIPILIALQ